MENNDVMFGNRPLEEWTTMYPTQEGQNLTDEQAVNMGLLEPEPETQEVPQAESENKEYKKLSVGETLGDIGKTMGAEALKIVAPKENTKLANKLGWSEANLYQHQAETRIGEASKYLYRYGMGTLSFIFGGGKVGAAIKGVGAVKNSAAITKIGTGIQKLFGADKVIKTGANASKLAKAGAFVGNGALSGAFAGGLSDFTFYRNEEGHLADAFGVTDNPMLTYLQSDDNDSDAEAKFKNVVEGFIVGIPFGIGIDGARAAGSYFKSVKKVATAQTAEKAAAAIPEAMAAESNLKNILETAELADSVKQIKATADSQGLDAEQIIIDTMNPKNYDDAKGMLKILDEGNDIYVKQDGTFAIRVETWEDAAKVTPDEYKSQLKAMDEDMMNSDAINYGDTALSHQDAAVRDTWTNRGWIGENEELTKANANKVAKNYTDKWEIDNNIKVEFVDGLTINGQAVEGNTSATKYQGKTSKSKQNAIDKKKLQISKLEDKITMAEGGNAEVADPLDNLKEELRIAKNELKELEKSNAKKDRISNITIQIDKNAKNPYATLRSELEHARDIAKGEIPDQNSKHFSRYEGMNEGEVAPDYVYKKAQGKAKATSQNFMNDGQIVQNDVKYNQETINNESRTNGTSTKATSGEGLYGTRPSESTEGISRTDTRRSFNSSSDNGSIVHTPDPEFKQQLEAEGKVVNNYKELAANSDEDAASFISNFRAANEINGKLSAQVYEYSPEEYKQMRLFTAENGKSGFALKPDGDIVSVFSAEKGSFDGLMQLAIQNGGTKLDCFDTFLPKIYKKHGFVEVDRVKWDEQYKPDNWDKEYFKQFNNGEPDVVYMELKKETSEAPVEPQQLKIDFSSTEEAVSKVTQGEIVPQTMGDIDAIVTKASEIDPVISGKDFEALAKDSDKLSTEIADLLELSEAFDIKTLWQEDGDTLRKISRKQLTTTKILSQLRDKMASLGKDAPIETKRRYVDTINNLMAYVSDIGSAKGTLLNEQKFLNKALETFGSQRLSKLNKDGISQFVDLLRESIDEINLQFTRGSAVEKKQALYAKLAELDPTMLAAMGEDLEFAAKFDKIVDDIIKNPQLDMQKAYQGLEDIFTEREYADFIDKAELAPTKKGWFTTLKNWSNEQGGLASYYVHNLLSGVGSLFKNIASGGINTVYFPARKILAGLGDMSLSADQKGQLYREGINTYKNLITTWNESWQLCCQAFLKGDGKLSSIGNDTLNMDSTFKGFHEIGVDGGGSFWETMQNIHSIMTRAMGASDEFMSQLNYRSIARAKAMEIADKLAIQAGKANDEAWIEETVDTIFKKYFTADGKPLDAGIYNEAKTILYQNPLDGKMFDPSTGGEIDARTGKFLEKGEKATQTAAMKLGASFQKAANENLLVKFFFPFVKTGTNILQMNLDHNIWYNLASPSQRQILKSHTVEGALLRSQCAFGAFSFAFGSMLALNGMVTGSMPADAKERKALLATGWRPYSFKVGNKFVSYQGYEPIHTMLGFSADFANLMMSAKNKNDEDRAMKFAMQAGGVFVNNFLDKAAFRTGLRSMSALFELDERHIGDWQQAMAQPISGLLPNATMVKNLSTVGTRAATAPKSVYERVFNMYFNRGLGEYRRDAFGDKQNIFNAIITSASSQGNEPEYAELSRLAELGYKPTEVGETISGYNLNYNDFTDPETGRTAYDLMQEELSKTDLKEKVRELVTSDYYQTLDDGINNAETKAQGFKWTASDDTKVNMLNDLFIEYNDMVKEKVENEYPQLINKKGQTIQEAAEQAEIIKMDKQLGNQLNDSAEKLKSIF